MQAADRLVEVEGRFSDLVERVLPLDLDGETLRLILYLRDGTTLRLAEQWNGTVLERYSYYWLTGENQLKIGWDNAPHHTRLETFPHHKHVERQDNLQSSSETILEEVMEVIRRGSSR
ncbi:MAG: hypothetical protein HYW07_14010 [Candidatus Latescibacteria bacterium]|nr:hypothetical protein [Candidatus Latescibacterota bacterium]